MIYHYIDRIGLILDFKKKNRYWLSKKRKDRFANKTKELVISSKLIQELFR